MRLRPRGREGADAARRRGLLQLALTLLVLTGIAEALIQQGPLSSLYVPYLFPVDGALYMATGLLAWWRRPSNRLGALMTACGTAITVSSLANSAVPVLFAVGMITATLPLSMLLHVVHASPSGTVEGRAARITVAAGYVVGLLFQVPIWAFTPVPPPFDLLTVSPRPHVAEIGADVQEGVGGVVLVATVTLLVLRLRRYSAADRRLLAGLVATTLVAVLAVVLGADLLDPLGLGPEGVVDVQLAAVAIVPVAFLLVVLRGGFTRPGPLATFAETVATVAGMAPAGHALDRAVAIALGDPSAAVLRWSPTGYRDADGRSADPATGADPHRAVLRIDGPGGLVGAIVHDTALGVDPVALTAVSQVVGIALERERLAVELLASRTALQDASRRLLEAADDERRRITRDLHDGLQGGLVVLALQARGLARDAGTDGEDDLAKASTVLAEGIDVAARTLRDLVAGVLPSPLVERGLAAAVRDLADGLPLPVEVSVRPADLILDAPVETTAYFAVAEALTNVVKHAGAGWAAVRLEARDNALTVEVLDDGRGHGSYIGGTGLVGLSDRLAILGGTVEVTDTGAGTRVLVHLPCG